MPTIDDELRRVWEASTRQAPELNLAEIRVRAAHRRNRRRVLVVSAAAAATLVTVLVVQQISGLPADVAPAVPSMTETPASTPEPTDSDADIEPEHGWAQVAGTNEYGAIPGEGWWTVMATPDSYDDIRSLQHPDTILVAGFDETVVEGFVRDPGTGSTTLVPGAQLDPVPVDPDWPDTWLIIDAHTYEVLDEVTLFTQQAVPVEEFVADVASSAGLEVERVDRFNTAGVDVSMTSDDGLGVTYTADPGQSQFPQYIAEKETYQQSEVAGFDTYQQRNAEILTTVAISDTGVVVFLSIGVLDPSTGATLDNARADELTADLLPLLLAFDSDDGEALQ